ncbi:MAG: FAD-binding oxidoreductase [Rhodobacteraceae bacterium]|nr:FAD-binding oxidoreductase [Paracoccaceae bacterium]
MPEARIAKRLPTCTGAGGWNAILPPREAAAALNTNSTADVVVIGAGFAGLSAAFRISQIDPGAKVAILEAGHIAEGSAGRNSGFMIDLPHNLSSDDYAGAQMRRDISQTRVNRKAIAFAGEMAATFGFGTDIYHPDGKINGAATEKGHRHNLEYAAHLKGMDEPCELFDAQSMRDITGTGYYSSGLFTGGTVMLQPAAYIRGLADKIGRQARIYEHSPVCALQRNSQSWLVKTAAGRIEAPKVILAVNGHAESFGYFKRRLMHVFTYASMTRAMTEEQCRRLGGRERWSLTPADPMGVTVRRISGHGGNRILIRSRFTYDPGMEVGASRVAAVGARHDAQFAERFPMLTDLAMEYRWAGLLCLSRNDVPAFGEVENGIYAACCQNGLGVTKGTLSGMAAAELVCGHRSATLEALGALDEPARLPPEPLTWLAANAIMRWKEWRAGRE